MRLWFPLWIALSALLQPRSVMGQLIGNRTETSSCENEKVSPNLTIVRPVRLTGILLDATRAPITFNKATIQVRDSKNEVMSSANLDQRGGFDLGILPVGRFRLVAFRRQENEARRLPLFDQPKPQFCSGDSECHLEIVLAVHGTDQRFEFCPPK